MESTKKIVKEYIKEFIKEFLFFIGGAILLLIGILLEIYFISILGGAIFVVRVITMMNLDFIRKRNRGYIESIFEDNIGITLTAKEIKEKIQKKFGIEIDPKKITEIIRKSIEKRYKLIKGKLPTDQRIRTFTFFNKK